MNHMKEAIMAVAKKSYNLGRFIQKSDFRKHQREMCEHFASVQGYFLKKMQNRDIEAIRELVELNCSFEEGFDKNEITINGVL